MIKEYERNLRPAEQKALEKEIEWLRKQIPKKYFIVFGFCAFLGLTAFLLLSYPNAYLIVPLTIASFFIVWYLRIEIPELIRLAKFMKERLEVVNGGVATVREINIDRYIRIDNQEDEGNYFIVEFEKRLAMIGGQEFFGIRKLKNRIEEVKIMDSKKKGIYYERINKYGNAIEPLYVFKGDTPNSFLSSDLFQTLISKESIPGTLEELKPFIDDVNLKRNAR
jgi:hypothetical protein